MQGLRFECGIIELEKEEIAMKNKKNNFAFRTENMDVRQKHEVCCPCCGQVCCGISDLDLRRYKRTWQLAKMKALPDKLMEEYERLCNLGFRYVNVLCPNEECKYEDVILCEKHWNEIQK